MESIKHDHFNIKTSKSSANIRSPCSICNKSVLNNQKAIECDTCGKWIHRKCDGTSNGKYEELKLLNERAETDPNAIHEDWWCLRCKIKFQCDNVPFTFQDNIDLENLNNTDSNMFFEMLPKSNIMSEISNISNKAHDIDANIDDPINCKHYSVEDLKTIPKKKALNIFHSNVNGLDTHFENLY